MQIELVSGCFAWFEFWNIYMVRSTVAQAQTNYHVLQFGHWNQAKADT